MIVLKIKINTFIFKQDVLNKSFSWNIKRHKKISK